MFDRGRRFRMLVVSIAAISLFSAACSGLRIKVSETLPPEFTFNVGRFAECCTDFRLFAVLEDDSKQTLWRITSKTVVEKDQAILMTISYGKVPAGFEQEIPAAGEPPRLSEGKTYLAAKLSRRAATKKNHESCRKLILSVSVEFLRKPFNTPGGTGPVKKDV
jgi:hypothetical protein